MESASLLALTHNATLLLAIIFIYDLMLNHQASGPAYRHQSLVGIGLGAAAIIIMLTPWEFAPGIIFDTRSVLLGMSGLFFGLIPTVIAMLIAAVFRFYQGGSAVLTGIGVILLSGLAGLLWRHFREHILIKISVLELYLFGIVTHLIMLGLMFILPLETAKNILTAIGVQVLVIYPLAAVLLGVLFSARLRRKQLSELLAENEFLFRSQFDCGNIGIVISSVGKKGLRINPCFCAMLDYSAQELREITWVAITHPDDVAKDLAQFERVMAGEIDGYELEKRFIHKDGSVVYAHINVSCYRNAGQVQFFIVSVLDTTQQKQAERIQRANEEQLTLVLAGGELGFWDWDIVHNVVERNARWAEMLGYSHEEVRQSVKQWIEFVHPEDRERVRDSLNQHLEGITPQHKIEYRMLTKQDGYRWILDSAKVVSYSSEGKPLRMCGTHMDITDRKHAEESMQLTSMVYENTSEAIMIIDADGMIVTINPAFTELTQYSYEEIINQYSGILAVDSEYSATYKEARRALKTIGSWRGESQCRRKNGEAFAIWLALNTIYNPDGTPFRRVILFSDITDKKQSEEIIWHQANFDQLTQLPNRRMFLDHLEQEIKMSARHQQLLALLFLDLDLFKEVNDTLGHDMGDRLLKQAAQRLRSCVRETDIVARLGGDEFTIILSNIDNTESIERIAQEILKSLAEPFLLGVETAYISTSIGITLYPDDAKEADVLLKNADQAMYAAKRLGRNRFNYFTASMQEAAKSRMRLINDLHLAIDEQQFLLCYQPIVDLRSGQITKAEALIRWQHPVRGVIAPDEFISVAEDTGMIVDIGNWVFREVAKQVTLWRSQLGIDVQISINKSPIQFRDEHTTVHEWVAHLQSLGLTGSAINIEITEGLLLEASHTVRAKLLSLRDAGIQVSLDDFGTGYSSLAYLKKFDIDYVKIDRSFTRHLTADSNEFALCEAIIVMAHKLNMNVVAEGVETEEQRSLLAAAGCDYAQGYLYSEPLNAGEFAQRFLAAP